MSQFSSVQAPKIIIRVEGDFPVIESVDEKWVIDELSRRFRISRKLAKGILLRYIAEMTCFEGDCDEWLKDIEWSYGVKYISRRIRKFLESITRIEGDNGDDEEVGVMDIYEEWYWEEDEEFFDDGEDEGDEDEW